MAQQPQSDDMEDILPNLENLNLENNNNNNNNGTEEDTKLDDKDMAAIMLENENKLKMEKIHKYFPGFYEKGYMISSSEAISLIEFCQASADAAVDCIDREFWEYKNELWSKLSRVRDICQAVAFSIEMDKAIKKQNNNNNNNDDTDNNDNSNNKSSQQ